MDRGGPFFCVHTSDKVRRDPKGTARSGRPRAPAGSAAPPTHTTLRPPRFYFLPRVRPPPPEALASFLALFLARSSSLALPPWVTGSGSGSGARGDGVQGQRGGGAGCSALSCSAFGGVQPRNVRSNTAGCNDAGIGR